MVTGRPPRVLGTGLTLIALGAICWALVACTPAGPPMREPGEVLVLPVRSSASTAASAIGTRAAEPTADLVANVGLRHRFNDPPGHCYCAAVFATGNVTHERLEWKGAIPPLQDGTLLFVTDLARMQCAIPYGVGVPSFDRATPNGADVDVDLTWRFDGEPVQSAAVIPAPAPGGRVFARLHGSWMRSGDSGKVERCEASR